MYIKPMLNITKKRLYKIKTKKQTKRLPKRRKRKKRKRKRVLGEEKNLIILKINL